MKTILNNPTILKEKEYLTIEETTELFGVHENTLYTLFRKGEMKPIKHFQRNYLKTSDILDYTVKKFGKESVSKWIETPLIG